MRFVQQEERDEHRRVRSDLDVGRDDDRIRSGFVVNLFRRVPVVQNDVSQIRRGMEMGLTLVQYGTYSTQTRPSWTIRMIAWILKERETGTDENLPDLLHI